MLRRAYAVVKNAPFQQEPDESAEAIRCTVGAAQMSKSTSSKTFIHRQPRCSNITGASPMFNAKFAVGDRVEDRDSKRVGTIVHVYKDREIRDELVAVRFDDNPTPLAVHIDDLYKRTSPKPAVLSGWWPLDLPAEDHFSGPVVIAKDLKEF
jgi:hypothetical protein